MSTAEASKGSVISGADPQTRDWYAWNNLMPPKPDDFHVVGEVQVANPGVLVILRAKEPQGINPDILLMELFLVQQPGIWPRVICWAPIQYDKVLMNSTYKGVEIYYGNAKIAEIAVDNIQ